MLYIWRWYEISVLGFIVRLVPYGLFAHLPLRPYCDDFALLMMLTYQTKDHILMQDESFELKCTIDFYFLLYAKRNTSVELEVFLEVPFLWAIG